MPCANPIASLTVTVAISDVIVMGAKLDLRTLHAWTNVISYHNGLGNAFKVPDGTAFAFY